MDLEIKKIYGPYLIKKGRNKDRKQILIYYNDNSRRTLLYSRYLIEQKLGRKLLSNEQVDHIDRDKTNDSIENLQIIYSRSEHSKIDAKRLPEYTFTQCIFCCSKIQRKTVYINGHAKKGYAGPFCSKVCSGTYSKNVQLKLIDKLPAQSKITTYFYKDKI